MPSPPPPHDRRFILVTGKGGVGKTTVTAALAARSAAQGRRTLVCELNTQERIAPLFGHAPVGDNVTCIADHLWSVNIEPRTALEEYGLMKLRVRALYRLVFEHPAVERFVDFMPGANELFMLGKAFNHEREVDSHGRPVWDAIFIDAPATGHGLMFFRLPEVIRDAVPAGNLHAEASAMWDLLVDPVRTAVHLVTLPEELPAQETLELHRRLREYGMPLGYLFLNMVPGQLFDRGERAIFDRMGDTPPHHPALSALWATTRIRLGREAMAQRYGRMLDTLGLDRIDLPIQYSARFGLDELASLTRVIADRTGTP